MVVVGSGVWLVVMVDAGGQVVFDGGAGVWLMVVAKWCASCPAHQSLYGLLMSRIQYTLLRERIQSMQ